MCRIRGLNSHNHNEKKLVPASFLRGSCIFSTPWSKVTESEILVYINKLTSPFDSITNGDLTRPCDPRPEQALEPWPKRLTVRQVSGAIRSTGIRGTVLSFRDPHCLCIKMNKRSHECGRDRHGCEDSEGEKAHALTSNLLKDNCSRLRHASGAHTCNLEVQCKRSRMNGTRERKESAVK
jgi:hypothetical protein